MKLALDGMGGDNAPKSVVEGALLALEQIPNLEIQLYGQQDKLEPFLKQHDRLTIIHCEEIVEGTDDPARAVRRKRILQWLV